MSESLSPPPSAHSGSVSSSRASSTSSTSKPTGTSAKPSNVFSNDGSFLERLKLSKKEEEEKRKQKETLERKKTFDNRFKNRGKRPLPAADSAETTPEDDQPPAKKAKNQSPPLTQYQKELNNLATPSSLKDSGTGVRPLVK